MAIYLSKLSRILFIFVALLVASSNSFAVLNDNKSESLFSIQLRCEEDKAVANSADSEYYLDFYNTYNVCVLVHKVLTEKNIDSACVEKFVFDGDEEKKIIIKLDNAGRDSINNVTKDNKGKLLAVIVNDIVIYNLLIFKNITSGIFELGTVDEEKVDYIIKYLNLDNQYCGSSKKR